MFLHLIGVSLAEPFNLVSNVWHVEIMISSIIGNVPRSVDNDSEISVLKSLEYFYICVGDCAPQLDAISPDGFKNCLVQLFSIDSCDLPPSS